MNINDSPANDKRMIFGLGSSQPSRITDMPVVSLLVLAGVLIVLNVLLFQSFRTTEHVRECHASALTAAEEVSGEIEVAHYYEFVYRTCMRSYGEKI